MSDWRLVNKEGTLIWTSPALPGGGTSLHTTLSPTIILAATKKGDALPKNFVKIPDITRVSAPTPTSIQLERRIGSTVLLVCNEGPQEAAVWLQNIQRAVGGGGSLAANKPGANKPGTSPAGMNNTPPAGSTTRSDANPAGPGASGSSAPATPTAGQSQPRPSDPRMNSIAEGLRNDLRNRPVADPNAAQTTPRHDGGGSSSAAGGPNTNNTQPPLAVGGNASSNYNNSSASNSPDRFGNQHQQQQQPGSTNSSGINAPAPGSGVNLPVVSASGSGTGGTPQYNRDSNSNSPGPTSPNSRSPLQHQQQQDRFGGGSNVGNNNTSQLLGRGGPQQQQQQQQQGPQQGRGGQGQSDSSANYGGRSMQQPNQLNPNQLQQQSMGGGSTTPSTGARTPMGTNSALNQRNQQQGGSGHPVASTTTQKQQWEDVGPGSGGGNIRPVQAPMLGAGGGGGGTPFDVNANNTGNSGFGGGSSSTAGAGGTPFDVNANNTNNNNGWNATTPRPGLQQQQQHQNQGASSANASHGNFSDAGSSALRGIVDSLPDGSLVAAARRRGMMVGLPATQSVNRSIAPNASALWKEWRDPSGVLYVLHEPTGTLQRLAPGESKFKTYLTDEQMVRAGGQVDPEQFDSPSHQTGDPTLNMDEMMVSNLQNYGSVGSGMSGGNVVPPVPAAGLMHEMKVDMKGVPVPRGQFSPSRRAQAEPLAVPRVSGMGYHGKRIHRFTLHGSEDPRVAVVEHQVQSLDTEGVKWDPQTREIVETRNEHQRQHVKSLALNQQWEHVKRQLQQGRYFKKHAFRKSNTSAYRYVFLSADNQWVCSVPTSDVMVKVQGGDGEQFIGPEAQQYFPADTKAMSVNSISAVVLATEEERLRYRGREMDLESTFLIVSHTHMLILECNSPEEAKFFADAWNYYLFYSKPEKPKRTPQMLAPVTYGTRAGVAW